MPLAPGYGETPLPHDELTALTPSVVDILDSPITKAAVYDLEQGIQDQVSEELITAAIEGSLLLDQLLTDYFIRDLHRRLYGDVWVWAGRFRRHEVNIGVAPEHIAVELRSTLDNIRCRRRVKTNQVSSTGDFSSVVDNPLPVGRHRGCHAPCSRYHGARRDREDPSVRRRKWAHDKTSR